jgi:hypothetical protein
MVNHDIGEVDFDAGLGVYDSLSDLMAEVAVHRWTLVNKMAFRSR